MVRTGTQQKPRTKQSLNGELGLIIEEFSRAMWSANREYLALPPACSHENWVKFTPRMDSAWALYIDFCQRNPRG